MDRKALEKASLRLRVAKANLEAMRVCKTYGEFSEAWYIFLHAAKGIYTTLEQGSKTSPQARQWFAKKNQERKDDPLLRYITEARNDDEHGIEAMSSYDPGVAALGINQPGASTRMIDENGNIYESNGMAVYVQGPFDPARLPKLRPLDGKPVASIVSPPTAHLVTVHDRSGRPYDPPTSHLGADISNPSPLTVAELMTQYLNGLVDEAGGFQKP